MAEDSVRLVAVIEADSDLLTHLARPLEVFDALAYSTLDEMLDAGLAEHPGVVLVLGPSQSDEEILDRIGGIIRSRQGVGAVLVVQQSSAALLRTALRAGIDDAVEMRAAEAELQDVVREISYRLSSELASGSVERSVEAPRRSGKKGRITTVFSPKGGVGKSVVAVNLAAALARKSNDPVALIDLDLQFGDVAVMLRMAPNRNIVDAAASADRLDAVMAKSLLTREQQTGVFVLPAPGEPALAGDVNPAAVSALFEALREMGAHVVVDTPTGLSDLVLHILADSDDVVFVVGMDIPSVKNARLGLQAFELLEIPLDRVMVVLNRADSKVHLAVRDVERTLQMKVDISLPSEALVPQSVNQGAAAVLTQPRSRFAGAVEQLAQLVKARAVSTDG
ncbi:MAG TPA: P-loop NTPase [Acidimicrobiales bacterium]|nr:P-loop NTPase [Acidimicrobiales bacterium]